MTGHNEEIMAAERRKLRVLRAGLRAMAQADDGEHHTGDPDDTHDRVAPAPSTAPSPAGEPQPPARRLPPTPPPGMAYVDAATLDALRADADVVAQLEQQRAQQRAADLHAHHEQLIDAAMRDGRLLPRHHDAWLNAMDTIPETAHDLDALARGRYDLPLEEIGRADHADDQHLDLVDRLWRT